MQDVKNQILNGQLIAPNIIYQNWVIFRLINVYRDSQKACHISIIFNSEKAVSFYTF